MIRPASEAELKFVRGSWTRAWNPCPDDLRNGLLNWGHRRSITAGLARAMHGALVHETATPETALVWAVDGGEPLAWCCRELIESRHGPRCLVHFVYTVKPARSRGLASSLLTYVQAEADTISARVVHTHENACGRALLRKLRDHDQQRADLS